MKSKRLFSLLGLLVALTLTVVGLPLNANAANNNVEFSFKFSDNFKSIKFSAVNPADPADKKDFVGEAPEKFDYAQIPAGWQLSGQIVMQPGRVLTGTGDSTLTANHFTIERQGEGNASYLVYTLNDFTVNDRISLIAWQTQPFNHATFYLEGGTWTDKTPLETVGKDGLTQSDNSRQMFILPYETVYKPTDPVREGYKFKGWIGYSSIDKELNAKKKKKTFYKNNPYQFDEVDPNIAVNYTRGEIVRLWAEWEEIPPTLEIQDTTIFVGDDFDPKSLITSAKDYAGNDISDTVIMDGLYRVDKPGTYPITYTVKDRLGRTASKVGNLIVKQKPAVIVEAPVLDTNEKTVFVGDEIDFSALYGVTEEGTEVYVDSKTKINTGVAGTYPVTLIAINKDGVKTTKTVDVIVKDKFPAPKLEVQNTEITAGQTFDPKSMIANAEGGKISISTETPYNPCVPGSYPVKFLVTNAAGVTVEKQATLTVKAQEVVPGDEAAPGTNECVCAPAADKATKKSSKPGLPKTGEAGFAAVGFAALVAAGGIALFRRKK